MTRKIYTSRPPKQAAAARIAWDIFTKMAGKEPKQLWFTHLDYWVWVVEYADGETDDIEASTIAHYVREKTVPQILR